MAEAEVAEAEVAEAEVAEALTPLTLSLTVYSPR